MGTIRQRRNRAGIDLPQRCFGNNLLEKLKAFHQELEETVPYLDEVRSLVNITSMRGEEGDILLAPAMMTLIYRNHES